jgi:hypothetical protein
MFLAGVSVVGAVTLGTGLAVAAVPPPPPVEALIMGGTGRPMPSDFPGYMESVRSYYIEPNTACDAGPTCASVSVFTPETAWPLYGGLTAPTWKDSIDMGVTDFDTTFQQHFAANPSGKFVLFGYSQSGAIIAIEKQHLADTLTSEQQQQSQIVSIGDSSRPNGGINTRIPFSIPIVNFPYGPPTPTDTDMQTTDIAFKWDIIADSPTYLFNPLAWANALLGFEYVHGTMPDPNAANPDSTPGGYSVEQWQDMMDHPENYPDLIDIQTKGDTKYLTVTPTTLPLVQPLKSIPLIGTPIADLLEPSLRVIIEQTGYDRTINPGDYTPVKLIPIFNPITLAVDLVPAVIQGVQKFISDLGSLGGASSMSTLSTTQVSPLAAPQQKLSVTTTEDKSELTAPKTDLTPSKLSSPAAPKLAAPTATLPKKPHWQPGDVLTNLLKPHSTKPETVQSETSSPTATTTTGTGATTTGAGTTPGTSPSTGEQPSSGSQSQGAAA